MTDTWSLLAQTLNYYKPNFPEKLGFNRSEDVQEQAEDPVS